MNLIERAVVGLCRLMLWISTAVIFVILVVNTVLRVMDPLKPEDAATHRVLAELPGPGWNAGTLSRDDKT